MKLFELEHEVSDLVEHTLGAPTTLDDQYVSAGKWKEIVLPSSCKIVWVTQGPAEQTGATFWYEAEVSKDKLKSLTRWYSDDATEDYCVEIIQ